MSNKNAVTAFVRAWHTREYISPPLLPHFLRDQKWRDYAPLCNMICYCLGALLSSSYAGKSQSLKYIKNFIFSFRCFAQVYAEGVRIKQRCRPLCRESFSFQKNDKEGLFMKVWNGTKIKFQEYKLNCLINCHAYIVHYLRFTIITIICNFSN